MTSLNKIDCSFFINLDKRTDRLNHINKSVSFNTKRFQAKDKSDLTTEEAKKFFPTGYCKKNKGEIACSISHYLLWKKLIDLNLENMLILEDDVVFKENFETHWNDILSPSIPKHYSIIYLGGCQPWNKNKYRDILYGENPYFKNVKQNDLFIKDSHYWHMNAQSYILSRAAAEKLCQHVERYGFEIEKPFVQDVFATILLSEADHTKVFHLNPPMSRQIHEEGGNAKLDKNSDLRFCSEKFTEPGKPQSSKIEFENQHTQDFYELYNISNPSPDNQVFDLSKINESIKKENLKACVVSCGGTASNSFVRALEKDGIKCISLTWARILCHCPHFIDIKIPIIYIYRDPREAWMSVKRRGMQMNQWKLANSFNIELTEENLLSLMITQIEKWTSTENKNLLKLEYPEIFKKDCRKKVSKFLSTSIQSLPLPEKKGKTDFSKVSEKDSILLRKYSKRINSLKLITNQAPDFPNISITNLSEIPKVAHISWKRKDILNKGYKLIDKGVSNLCSLNPEWDVIIYDDEDVNKTLRDCLGASNWACIKNKTMTAKTDLWRLIKTYQDGGLYTDIDRYIDTPISEILTPETKMVIPTYLDVDFSQDFILTFPSNPIIGRAIESNLRFNQKGASLFSAAVESYLKSLSKSLSGIEVERGHNPEYFNKVRSDIDHCEYLSTYRELGPQKHILFRDVDKNFNPNDFDQDKADFYNTENVESWNSETREKFKNVSSLTQHQGVQEYLDSINPEMTIEGGLNSSESREQGERLRLLVKQSCAKNIMEIGFNAGHSSELFLSLDSKINITSFDIGVHKYIKHAKEFIDKKFPGRHELVIGDSMKTIPKFYLDNPNRKFDLIFIDGGHSELCAISDLVNSQRLAHENTIVVLDDTRKSEPMREWNKSVNMAWLKVKNSGKVKQLGSEDYGENRGQSWGKYAHLDQCKEKIYNVCFCCDENLINYIINPINALSQKNKEKNITIHLIYSGKERELISLKEFIKNETNLSLKTYLHDEIKKEYGSWRSIDHLSNAINLKLKIPEILLGVSEVLYFDIDTIPFVDLSLFDNIKLNESGIALKPEIKNGWRTFNGSKGTATENKNPVEFGDRIIGNTGVMLLNLDLLRRNEFTKKCFEIKKRNTQKIPIGSDQDIINIYCECDYTVLDDNLNCLNSEQLDSIKNNVLTSQSYDCFCKNGLHHLRKTELHNYDAFVLHFIGKDKPWNSDCAGSDFWQKFSINKIPKKQNSTQVNAHSQTKQQQFIELKNQWEKFKNYDFLKYVYLKIKKPEAPKDKFSAYNLGKKIAIVSMYTSDISEFGTYSEESIKDYCLKNNYTFYIYRSNPDPHSSPNWAKPKLILNHIIDHDYIIWMDSDTIILNPEKKIEDITGSTKKEIIASSDIGGKSMINSGVIFFKNSEFCLKILESWKNFKGDKSHLYASGGDQEILCSLIRQVDPINAHTEIMDMSAFNTDPRLVKDDTFILHFMAYPKELKSIFMGYFMS
jgi:GR25 family glycosyltransferase involved in LPS biosynthesis/lipopolysaccharide biosynthesis glycosyltransferase/predicted O-methyltransferase YrrM/mannosyltransferase OCH1-like enzyme